MAELKFRLNLDAEEIELLLDDKVVDTIEKTVVHSWVTAINDKHRPLVSEPVEPVKPEAPVETEPVSVDNPVVEEEVKGEENA